MAEIFTSRGKKTAEDRSHKAIAFDAGDDDAEGYIAFGGVKTPKAILCSLCPPQPPQNPEKRAIDSWPGPWRALGCRTAPAAPTAAPTAPTAAAPTAAAPTDRQQRLERARAAQARAIARHSEPEPVNPQTEAVRVVDRSVADPSFGIDRVTRLSATPAAQGFATAQNCAIVQGAPPAGGWMLALLTA